MWGKTGKARSDGEIEARFRGTESVEERGFRSSTTSRSSVRRSEERLGCSLQRGQLALRNSGGLERVKISTVQ